MKIFLIIITIFGGLNLWAKNSYMLSLEEYKALSTEQQAQYIRSVQKVLAEMTKQAIYMADDKNRNSRVPAASSEGTASVPPDNIMEAMAKLPVNAQLAPASAVSPASAPSATKKSNDDEVETVLIPEKMKKTQDKTPVAKQQAPASSAAATTSEQKPANSGASYVPPNQNPREVVDLSAASKIKSAAEKKSEDKKIHSTGSAKLPTDTVRERGSYRCMYSGWVITEDPCAPVTSFPANYSIDKIDSSKMVCDEGKTMCNPTVFGLKIDKSCKSILDCPETAKPICVRKGGYPTEDCYKQTSFKEAVVAAEINSKLAPSKYSDFLNLIDDLCDGEQIQKNQFAEIKDGKPRTDKTAVAVRADIERTCKSATAKLAVVKEAYLLPSQETRQKWADEKEKANPKRKKAPVKAVDAPAVVPAETVSDGAAAP